MAADARASDFYRRARPACSPEVTDRDIQAACGHCCLELTLDLAEVEFVGATTGYNCPACSTQLLVVAAIPGEHGLVGMRTTNGARAWLTTTT